MSYRIEGKDIVIAGFESGISDSIYSGEADMRNMEITTVPGEASVQLALAAATKPVVMNAVAYTAQDAGNTLTIASTAGLYNGTAIVLASNTATGLSNGIVYYVFNIVGNTFQVRLAAATGAAVNITTDGTGTLTTYQYGNQRSMAATAPQSYWVDRTGALGGANATFIVDGSNYVWAILSAAQGTMPGNTMIFMGNIGTTDAVSTSGVAIWNSYLLLFTYQGIDIARINTIWAGTGPAATWDYDWEATVPSSVNGRIAMLVSQEDGNLYWTTDVGVGSLIEDPSDTFNPTDDTTYSITDAAIPLPSTDKSTCLAELGTNLLIGGRNSFVYIWDKISLGFTGLLNIPDSFTTAIVPASQNAYVFAGNRGRIYITNGSGIDLYKKVPDYLTGAINPLIRWQDANFSRNRLIFGFTATTNAGTVINTVSGAWAIELDTDALYMINKTTNTGYTGTTRMVVEAPPANGGNPVSSIRGTSIQIGWHSASDYTVDLPTSVPYTNYESFIQTEMIPVGTYVNPFSPSQLEWKASAPLVSGEGVRLSYRKDVADAWTLVGETTAAGKFSDMFKANLQKFQWVQFLIETKSTATTPTYARLTEVRIRDWPSGTTNNVP